jgi:hypothetical protein
VRPGDAPDGAVVAGHILVMSVWLGLMRRVECGVPFECFC